MERKKTSRDDDKESSTFFKNVKAPIAGGLSGFLTRALTQPLDCIKVRHQLQVEPIQKNTGAKYTSTIQTLLLMFKEEGIRGLWKGHVPGQILSITYGTGQFLAYDQFNRQSRNIQFFNDHSDLRHIVAGGFAGAFGMSIATPFDVVRTRFIAQDHNRGYRSVFDAFTSIIRNEGIRGLFRGLVPGISAIAPNAAIQFGTYNFLIERYNKFMNVESPSRHIILLSGLSSGIIAKSCIYPLDLVKKRLQIQQFQQSRTTFGKNITTTGMIDCLRQTLRDEKISGLYKGWSPAVIKSGAMSGLYFFFYEEITTAINKF
jgi:solute carrier family 25 (mitochondrial thiamine pyrophosphate transporter), member 19